MIFILFVGCAKVNESTVDVDKDLKKLQMVYYKLVISSYESGWLSGYKWALMNAIQLQAGGDYYDEKERNDLLISDTTAHALMIKSAFGL